MEVFIPHTFSTPNAEKPWFSHACSRAVKDREVALRRFQSLTLDMLRHLELTLPDTPEDADREEGDEDEGETPEEDESEDEEQPGPLMQKTKLG